MLRKLAVFVFLLIPALVFGQNIQNVPTKSFFRAKFNNKTVESRIHRFKYWNEIQLQEVDTAFETYLKGPYAQKDFPNEAAAIFRLIEQGGFFGVIVEAHEKWEVLEYLKSGYSLEDIGGGRAHKEYNFLAHSEARFKELRLYQFWYKQLLGGNPPAMRAFLYVHPLVKMMLQDIYKIEMTTEIAKYLVRDLGKYEKILRSEQCSKKDIEKAIRFFEKTGYSYGDQKNLFLKRGLMFLREVG